MIDSDKGGNKMKQTQQIKEEQLARAIVAELGGKDSRFFYCNGPPHKEGNNYEEFLFEKT